MIRAEMTIQQAAVLAQEHGRVIDLIDAIMRQRGCSTAMLTENHLAAAVAYCSIERPSRETFSRLREHLNELEGLVVSGISD